MSAAASAIGQPAPSFSEAIAVGGIVKASHLTELRGVVLALEACPVTMSTAGVSAFSGNHITNTIVIEVQTGKFVPLLGMGLLVGGHPWGATVDVHDAGTVGPSSPISNRSDINVGPNVVGGANVNLLVEGVWNRTQPTTTLPGTVTGNAPADPVALPPANRLSNYYCPESHKYAVNPDHAKVPYDGAPDSVVFHEFVCGNRDPNDPVVQSMARPRSVQ